MTIKTPASPDEWLGAIYAQFKVESDRAAAIVAAAMLENAVASLLRAYLQPPVTAERSILDGDRAPLGSFAAKVDAAYQSGLISRYMARDLHLVRKIRNDFAHDPLHMTFDTPSVRDRVRALEATSDFNQRRPQTRDGFGPPGARWDFFGIVAWMLYALQGATKHVVPVETPGPEFGYIDWNSLPAEVQEFLRNSEAT